MKARDIMTSEVPVISMRKTVGEAVRILRNNYGDDSFKSAAPGLVVTNERGELAGIFSPLLIITKLLEKARLQAYPSDISDEYLASVCSQIKNVTVENIMERQAISVTEDACITDIAELFATHRFQRLPVVRDKKVVGIIYRSRLMFAMTTCLWAD